MITYRTARWKKSNSTLTLFIFMAQSRLKSLTTEKENVNNKERDKKIHSIHAGLIPLSLATKRGRLGENSQ